MTTWTSDELDKIGNAEELRLASIRSDGTLLRPVTIWVVRSGDDLYVRPVNGRQGAWYRGTQVRHEGRVWAGGLEREVTFVAVTNPDFNAAVDAAYRIKYGHYSRSVLGSVLTKRAREATLKLVPRTSSS